MCDRSCKIHESCNFVTDVEDEFRSEFEEKIDESEHKMMSLNGKLQLWPDNCPLNRPAPQGESDVFPFNFLQRSSFIQLTSVQSESQFQTLLEYIYYHISSEKKRTENRQMYRVIQ